MPTLLERARQSRRKKMTRRIEPSHEEQFELMAAWFRGEIGLTAANEAFNAGVSKAGNTKALTRFAYCAREAFQRGTLQIIQPGQQKGV